MNGFKKGAKIRCVNLDSFWGGDISWAKMSGCVVGEVYTVEGTSNESIFIEESKINYCLPIENFELVGEDDMSSYYNTNGDIVQAQKTRDVFLYVGGMYYNLSSDKKEMRGRKTIKRSDGKLIKLTNIANSGDMFKEATQEAISHVLTSHV